MPTNQQEKHPFRIGEKPYNYNLIINYLNEKLKFIRFYKSGIV